VRRIWDYKEAILGTYEGIAEKQIEKMKEQKSPPLAQA
jgi:hypothetical protein